MEIHMRESPPPLWKPQLNERTGSPGSAASRLNGAAVRATALTWRVPRRTGQRPDPPGPPPARGQDENGAVTASTITALAAA
jgi:hypothetical protein